MRTMLDSTNPYDIPADAAMVAGYVDGAYAWPAAGWARFPNAVKVRIACFATTLDADVLDVEAGCATADEAGAWANARLNLGHWVSLYYSQSRLAEVHDAVVRHGVGGWSIWIANWDGDPAIPPYAVAKQYANPTITGRHYDTSSVLDYWQGIDPDPGAPVVVPVPASGAVAADLLWQFGADVLSGSLPGLSNRVAAAARGLAAL